MNLELIFTDLVKTTVLRHSLDAEKGVYGYEILDLVGNMVMWPMCVALILVRNQANLGHVNYTVWFIRDSL